jgi:hypothetical protein
MRYLTRGELAEVFTLGNTDVSDTASLLVGLATPPTIASRHLAHEVDALFGGGSGGILGAHVAGYSHHDHLFAAVERGDTPVPPLPAGASGVASTSPIPDKGRRRPDRSPASGAEPAPRKGGRRGDGADDRGAAAYLDDEAEEVAHEEAEAEDAGQGESSPSPQPPRPGMRRAVVVVDDSSDDDAGAGSGRTADPQPATGVGAAAAAAATPPSASPQPPRRRLPKTVVDSDTDSDAETDGASSPVRTTGPTPAAPAVGVPPVGSRGAAAASSPDIPDSFAPPTEEDAFAWGLPPAHGADGDEGEAARPDLRCDGNAADKAWDAVVLTPTLPARALPTSGICARHAAACARIGLDVRSLRACSCTLTPSSLDLVEYALTSLWDEVAGGLVASCRAAGDLADAWETLEAALALADAEPRLHLAAAELGRRAGWMDA